MQKMPALAQPIDRTPTLPTWVALILITLFVTPHLSGSQFSAPARGFVSGTPATSWEQGLVSGNGKVGAIVLGHPADETIILNHARLFMPLHPPLPPVDTGGHLAEIRAMFAAGKYQQAADYVVDLSHREGWGGKRWTDPFIPAFDLRVRMEPQGAVNDYHRSVDYETGVATVAWRDSRGEFCRRLFVSRPDDVVVLSITGPTRGSVDCELGLAQRPVQGQGGWWAEDMFKRGIKEVAISAERNWLCYRSSFRTTWPGSLQGYEGAARVWARGGRITQQADRLQVRGADEVLVLTRIAFATDIAQSNLPLLKKGLAAVKPDFGALLKRHAKVHGQMFTRVQLDLGGDAAHCRLTSEDLIAGSDVGHLSKTLVEKEFDACRYAVISSSGELFPNLQGIWNGTWSPPWSADFTLNGNVQSALAADLSANMPECLLPFFSYLESHMEEYRENARRLYRCRGIHVPSRASSHGLNNHFDATWPMTFWISGAGWAAHFYYDYYLYTGDRNFLRTRALPFMKEAALFYEDFLKEGPDGRYLFSPSYSPENNPANNPSQACINATMDIAVARELLENLVCAAEELGLDADGIHRWRAMLAKLPDYEINKDGAIKEWTTPLLEDNYAHRHCSHLYALFDGLPEAIATNAPLRQAFRVAAEKRMEVRRRENGGIMAFGLVQLGQCVSSLRDPGMSYEVVDWLANKFWYPNMVTTHNPKELFNTDLCGGFPAIIIKMLADSAPGRLDLLPALPREWPTGKIEGILCRGQITIQRLEWRPDSALVTLKSGKKQQITLNLPGGIGAAVVTSGKATLVQGPDGSRTVTLPANKVVSLQLTRASIGR